MKRCGGVKSDMPDEDGPIASGMHWIHRWLVVRHDEGVDATRP